LKVAGSGFLSSGDAGQRDSASSPVFQFIAGTSAAITMQTRAGNLHADQSSPSTFQPTTPCWQVALVSHLMSVRLPVHPQPTWTGPACSPGHSVARFDRSEIGTSTARLRLVSGKRSAVVTSMRRGRNGRRLSSPYVQGMAFSWQARVISRLSISHCRRRVQPLAVCRPVDATFACLSINEPVHVGSPQDVPGNTSDQATSDFSQNVSFDLPALSNDMQRN
jgi:hypothetical protein